MAVLGEFVELVFGSSPPAPPRPVSQLPAPARSSCSLSGH